MLVSFPVRLAAKELVAVWVSTPIRTLVPVEVFPFRPSSAKISWSNGRSESAHLSSLLVANFSRHLGHFLFLMRGPLLRPCDLEPACLTLSFFARCISPRCLSKVAADHHMSRLSGVRLATAEISNFVSWEPPLGAVLEELSCATEEPAASLSMRSRISSRSPRLKSRARVERALLVELPSLLP